MTSEPDRTIRWRLGWSWFVAVALVHLVLLVAWWPVAGDAVVVLLTTSCAVKFAGASSRELWVFFLADGVTVHGPGGRFEIASCWMTPRLVVLRTPTRVLPVRAGAMSGYDFARLRRELIGSSASNGSKDG